MMLLPQLLPKRHLRSPTARTYRAAIAAVDAAEALVEYTTRRVDELASALPADLPTDSIDPRTAARAPGESFRISISS